MRKGRWRRSVGAGWPGKARGHLPRHCHYGAAACLVCELGLRAWCAGLVCAHGLAERVWGRVGGHRAQRNGAGIAADPTLTGVWTPEGMLGAWRVLFRSAAQSAAFLPTMSPGARAGAGLRFSVRRASEESQRRFPPRPRLDVSPDVSNSLAMHRSALPEPRHRMSLPVYPMIAAPGLNGSAGVRLPEKPSIFRSSSEGDAIIASSTYRFPLYPNRQAVLRGGLFPSSMI